MLNLSQKKAVMHGRGAALVLAGPGTGKTTVITQRVRQLVENGVDASSILVVTFTRMAAREMGERYSKLTEGKKGNVTFGTFHSLFLSIIKKSGYYGDVEVVSDKEKESILTSIVIENKIRNFEMKEFVRNLSGEISKVKGNNINIEEYQPKHCEKEKFQLVLYRYDKELKARSLIDFDDIIILCRKLLMESEKVRCDCRKRYQYILVDEFQDINYLQYETLKLIVGEEENIFAVGDDDQSIYGFRGAVPELMFQFRKDFKNARVINLDINYRSKKEIVECSKRLIRNNGKRFSKRISSEANKSGEVRVVNLQTQLDEYVYIAKEIDCILKAGGQLKDVAVLLRNNSEIANVENYLKSYGIDTSTKKKRTVFAHQISKDIINYMKAAALDDFKPVFENESLAMILNKPERMISRQIVLESECNLRSLIEIYKGTGIIYKNILKLQNDLRLIKNMDPYAAVNYIRFGVGYDRYIQNDVKDASHKKNYEKIINEIKREALRFRTKEEFINFAQNNTFEKNNSLKSAVNIMTIHSSKGLEFKHVFLPDVCQGIIPESRALREEEVEEERRLFYVALTRAVDSVHIICPNNYMGKQMKKSQFIEEIANY
ncbi:MAG: ATP-dependent helicase [Lachnospiraceae bacterium]|nr:ATP-dependent helicase [Lachnospiraceae bacterium]